MQTNKYSVKYDAFIKKYENTPKVAKVVIKWKDNKQQHDYLISLDDYWADDTPYKYRNTEMGVLSEENIFYHAGNIQGLYDLIESDREDFKVLDVIDYF